jgi:hypothetical protein
MAVMAFQLTAVEPRAAGLRAMRLRSGERIGKSFLEGASRLTPTRPVVVEMPWVVASLRRMSSATRLAGSVSAERTAASVSPLMSEIAARLSHVVPRDARSSSRVVLLQML